MTVEEIIAAMQAIIDEATASESAGGPGLTDENAERYEKLEGELARARTRTEIQRRHAALTAPAPGQVVTGAKPREDDTLDRAFAHYLRTGKENADLQELRAQNEGLGSAGGFTVPDRFRQKLVERMKAFGGLANVVDEFSTGDGAPVNWPTLDDTGNVGEIVAEGNTFAAGADLVFGEANLGAYKYMAGGAGNLPLRVSWELLQDSAFDIEALVSNKLGERIARIQAQHIATGTGVGQPQGIVTGRTPVQAAANTNLTYADLITWMHSVDPAYRESGRWAFNDTTLARIRSLVDLDGRPLLQPSVSGSAGSAPGGETLLGRPVTIDQAFDSYTVADSTKLAGVFGDLKEGYVVRRVKDVTIVADPYSRAANGQVQYTAWARMDAVQQNTAAYIVFSGKS